MATMRRLLPALALASVVALLAACASTTGGGGPATGKAGAAAPRPTLSEEQRRLADLFRGTPVVFAMQPDGSMRVSVPLRYSFDPGRFAVKPPLGAVLDRVAKSQRAE